MRVEDFDFALPDEAIARHPAQQRDDSRLFVLDRQSGSFTHATFKDLPRFLDPGDLLVMNDARVLWARLFGQKAESGGKVEILLIEPEEGIAAEAKVWKAMAASSKPLRPGARIDLSPGPASAVVGAAYGDGFFSLSFSEPAMGLAERIGHVPLPPYLGRADEPSDRERYQTVYAGGDPRSVAAPTAGLHFTPRLLETLRDRGVDRATLTLDVGPGTFLPVRATTVEEHVMHEERFVIPPETVQKIREKKGQVVAVGTTVVRALESCRPELVAGEHKTRLFVTPGHTFLHVDRLITNFHLPRSTLLMLVAAFAGHELIRAAYAEALTKGYRFFSYGDAMLIR
ncbi:MAG: tRNA preQ1(34) S-adenosylmethionine ribosyltransferase-isomerase QueA [Myxococcota bacterium]